MSLPTLVHGNLSSNNVAVRQTDGMPVLFSACAMYAHCEYELGAIRLAGNGFDLSEIVELRKANTPKRGK